MGKQDKAKSKLVYIDNLRIFLISLVVLHHLSITYGAPGGWFYNESEAGFPEIIPLSMFVATNQAFFMGMFFFISAYFVIPSLQRKGVGRFAKDRLIRLGIPTLFFFFILFPLTVYVRNKFIFEEQISYLDYVFRYGVFGFGPMWFVEALLIFTLAYLLWRVLPKRKVRVGSGSLPGTKTILLLATLIGLGQFIIRIWLPVGWSMPFTNFQFPHFLQYIFLFSLGTVAYNRNWLDQIDGKKGWRWFALVQLLIFVGFPVLFVTGGAMDGDVEVFMGGVTWQSLTYAIWEQLVGFGLILSLLGIFKFYFNRQGSFAKKLSSSAYGVYVFHSPILVVISFAFLDFGVPQFWKFVVLAPVALVVCFATGHLIKRIPVAKSIF